MKKHLFPILALSAAVFFLTLPAVHYGYLLEDYKYLRSYSLPEILQGFYSHWEPSLVESKGYRPLHSVHYAAFHFLIGADPVRNHVLQTVLLAIAALLIYLFTWRCTNNRSAAFWTALIYNCLGSNAWQASWINHRHHILQAQLVILSLLAFGRFLDRGRNTAWFLSFLFFLIAFLFKEEVATFPLVLAVFAVVIKGKRLKQLLRPLLPFFLLTVFLVLMRSVAIESLPKDHDFPPPIPLTAESLLNEYGRSLFSTLVQTYGVHDPENWEFPMYGSGLKIARDYIGFFALLGFLAIGGVFFLRQGSPEEKKTIVFGLALLLFVTVIVAGWYRNNRLHISSIGVALMLGPIVSSSFQAIWLNRRRIIRCAAATLAVLFFLTFLASNLASFFEIQHALRPDGTLSLLWDTWVYEEYLTWMKPEQMEIFRDKLLRSSRTEWAAQVTRLLELFRDGKISPTT